MTGLVPIKVRTTWRDVLWDSSKKINVSSLPNHVCPQERAESATETQYFLPESWDDSDWKTVILSKSSRMEL